MDHMLVGVGVEITTDCNLRCLHCFARGGESPSSLPHDDVLDLFDQLSAMKPFTVEISGGEPLLRKDFSDLISYAVSERNLPIIVSTNGTLISKIVAEFLSKLQVETAVSLDGSRPEIHDSIRKGGAAFSRTIRGIKNLVQAGIRPSVRTLVTKHNLQDLDNIAVLCRELGVRDVLYMRFAPVGRGEDNAKLLEITREDYRQVFDLVSSMRNDPDKFGVVELDCATPFPGTYREINIPLINLKGCPACHTSFNVRATGEVEPCPALRGMIAGDTKNNTLDDIWQKGRIFKMLRKTKIDGCTDCKYFLRNCYGGCRGHAFQTTGDVRRKDDVCWYKINAK